MMELDQHEVLPRLLDLDPPPPLSRQRWYWRYVHRWRKRLFHVWQRDNCKCIDDAVIGQAVDEIIGVALLIEHFRRSGCVDLPTLADACRQQTDPTIGSVVGAVANQTRSNFLASALQPNGFATLPFPVSTLDERWERRLADATWLVFRDRELPLSLFGDFHQLCTGSPLVAEPAGSSTRRARGMFYTPAPIVDYLVSTTLSKLLADRTPDELTQLKVLDPSCGCGTFLTGCFRFLVRWHEQCLGDRGLAHQYSLDLMGRAFLGCDIDPRALQWTARLLALAAWRGVKGNADCAGVSPSEAIPDFKPALSCRSFLEPVGDGESLFPEPQYDAIIGGPPFVRLESLHRTQEERLRYYRQRFLSAQRGKFDLYMLFIEQAIDLLKPGGLLAFSLSNSFLRSEGGRRIRGYIAANASVEEVLEFDDPRTYADAATQIALLQVRKTRAVCGARHVLVRGRGGLRQKLDHLVSERPHQDITITTLESGATASSRWRVTDRHDDHWLESIRKVGIPLGRFVTVEHGPSTGMDEVLLLRKVRSGPSEILARRRGEQVAVRLEAAAMRSVVRGHQLKRYGQTSLPNLCSFPYEDERGKPLSEAGLRATYPQMYSYLLSHRAALSRRYRTKGCPWYSTFVRLPRKASNSGRLMSARITSGGGFALIRDPKLLAHNSVVVLTPAHDEVDLYYLLGVLNSKVFSRYISLTMPRINAGRFSLRLSALRRFPVPITATDSDETPCRRIASLVREWLGISARPVRSELHNAIDAEVARLYDPVSKSCLILRAGKIRDKPTICHAPPAPQTQREERHCNSPRMGVAEAIT